jgi:hypothetical protein
VAGRVAGSHRQSSRSKVSGSGSPLTFSPTGEVGVRETAAIRKSASGICSTGTSSLRVLQAVGKIGPGPSSFDCGHPCDGTVLRVVVKAEIGEQPRACVLLGLRHTEQVRDCHLVPNRQSFSSPVIRTTVLRCFARNSSSRPGKCFGRLWPDCLNPRSYFVSRLRRGLPGEVRRDAPKCTALWEAWPDKTDSHDYRQHPATRFAGATAAQ